MAGCENPVWNPVSNLSPCSREETCCSRPKAARTRGKKGGKGHLYGMFSKTEWNGTWRKEEEGGKGKGSVEGNWMVARRRKNGATGLHWIVRDGPWRGWSRTKYKKVGEANDIHSHSSVGSGCCANEPQRRCEYRWYTVGDAVETERAC